jgi:hypothetical protein
MKYVNFPYITNPCFKAHTGACTTKHYIFIMYRICIKLVRLSKAMKFADNSKIRAYCETLQYSVHYKSPMF